MPQWWNADTQVLGTCAFGREVSNPPSVLAESLSSLLAMLNCERPANYSSTRHGVHPLTDTPDSSTLIRTVDSQSAKDGLSPSSGTTGFRIQV